MAHILIACPHCHRTGLKIRPEHLGRHVECKHCGKPFQAAAPEEAPTPSRESEPRDPSDQPRASNARPTPIAEDQKRLSADLARLETEIKTVKQQLTDALAASDRLRRDFEAAREGEIEARRRAEALYSERDKVVADRDRLSAELETLRGRLNKAEADAQLVDDHRAEAVRLAADAIALTVERDRLAKDLDKITAEAELASNDRDRLQKERDLLRSELIDAAQRTEETKARLIEEHQAETLRLETEWKAEQAERNRLGQELDRLKNEAKTALAERDGLNRDAEALREELEDARTRTAEADQRHEQAGAGVDALHEQIAAMEDERQAEAIRLGAEVASTRLERDRLAGDLARMTLEVETFRERLNTAETAARSVQELRAEVDSGRIERDRLRSEVDRWRERSDEAERLVNDARAETETLRGQIERLEEERLAEAIRLGAEVAAARAERDRLTGEVDRLRADAEQSSAPTTEIKSLRVERDQLAGEVAALRGQVDPLSARLADADRRVEQALGRAEGLSGDLARVNGMLKNAHEEAAASRTTAATLRDELERLRAERHSEDDRSGVAVKALRLELDEARSRSAADQDRIASLTEATSDLERRLVETIDDLNAASERAENQSRAFRDALVASPGQAVPTTNATTTDDPEVLARRLGELNRVNQQLCALLGVFGLPGSMLPAPQPRRPMSESTPASEPIRSTVKK